jgi:hypothetical protein
MQPQKKQPWLSLVVWTLIAAPIGVLAYAILILPILPNKPAQPAAGPSQSPTRSVEQAIEDITKERRTSYALLLGRGLRERGIDATVFEPDSQPGVLMVVTDTPASIVSSWFSDAKTQKDLYKLGFRTLKVKKSGIFVDTFSYAIGTVSQR